MHKKGTDLEERLIIWGFYLLLAVVVYLALRGLISEKSYFEDYFVRDLGLTIDILHNSPGNVNIEYGKLNDVSLSVKDNLIEVRSLVKAIPKLYKFTKNKNFNQLNYNFDLTSDYILKVTKTKNNIALSSNKMENK